MGIPRSEHVRLPATPRDRSSQAPDREADELSLWDFVDPVVGSWRTVAAVAILGGVLGFGGATLQQPMYEGVAMVRVEESKTGDQVETVRPENFRPLLENRSIAADLIREFAILSEPGLWIFPAGSTPMRLESFLASRVKVEHVTGTGLFRVRVRLSDAATAAQVANALVERALALNRRINQQEVIEARDYIKTQLDETTQRVDGLRAKLLSAKQDSQIDALKAESQATLSLRAGLLGLQAAIENERAFLARSEADLSASKQLLTTRRSIDRNPGLMEAAKQLGAGDSVLGLELSEEQINEAHNALQQQIAQSRAKLAGLEGQRRLLVDDQHLDRERVPVLTKLYDSEVAIAHLQAEYDMALKVYTDLAVRYEDARIRVGSRGAQLQLVDPAVAPNIRVWPRVTATTQLGFVLGMLLACLILIARHLLYCRRPDASGDSGQPRPQPLDR